MADARVAQIVARYEARSEGWAKGAIAYLLTELATAVRRAETAEDLMRRTMREAQRLIPRVEAAEQDADRLDDFLQRFGFSSSYPTRAAHQEAVAKRTDNAL